MTDLVDDIGRPTWLPFSVIAARLLLAAALGAAIGFEREWRARPAGLRTHILVCVAAATFAVLTVEIVHAPVFVSDTLRVDPIRIVEAVTAGVAFLAAGTIVLACGHVRDLTTGAGMWLAGGIGLAAGLGLWQIALLGAGLVLLVAGAIYSLEARIKPDGEGNRAATEQRAEP